MSDQTPAHAWVHQLSLSPGGLPKFPVPEADVDSLGIKGDIHRNMQVHGGPNQALLIVTLEGIEELRALGFTIDPGTMGENVTTRGLDRRHLRAGQQFRLGGEVIVELTKLRTPCFNLDAVAHGIGPSVYDQSARHGDASSPVWALGGFYARVVRGGRIMAGAPIVAFGENA
jgi:MOSC domain-containing protein YiiM